MSCGVNWKQAADIFQFPFDIIGSFTDVLSYIRLFAVGLAGACIAGSFNGMAFDLCQVSAWLIPAGVIVVVIGHALNIALALLSVLVHAVRLNTLEFSNHTGLSWSGQSFNPFKSHKQEDN
jgi:V/A-type H+-transporting ATPase subunit I